MLVVGLLVMVRFKMCLGAVESGDAVAIRLGDPCRLCLHHPHLGIQLWSVIVKFVLAIINLQIVYRSLPTQHGLTRYDAIVFLFQEKVFWTCISSSSSTSSA